jgi:MarR family transcriptional regulator, transcriptional regulator for hemolysin
MIKKSPNIYSKQPLGKFLSGLGRAFLNEFITKLHHLDIERNFYALILIEEGKGKITQQELATLLDTDKVSIVRIIDYLSGNGYVNRVKDPADRRKYGLILTDKAKKELPMIKKAIKEITQKALKGLSEKKIEELYNTLDKIKKNLN